VLLGLGLASIGISLPAAAVGGGAWSVVPSPDGGSASSANTLEAVSCVTTVFCVAVGNYRDAGGGYLTLVEHFDGARWSTMTSPSQGKLSAANILSGVSCASTVSCMAVGTVDDHALAERFDGTRWSIAPIPFTGAVSGGDVLNAVSCPSPSACTAVGYFDNRSGHSETLVESWDGTGWSRTPSPNAGPASAYSSASGPAHDLLNGVSCPSSSSCTAVGTYVTAAGGQESLILSWDGVAWSVVASPDNSAPSDSDALNGVSCPSSRDCVAVGELQPSSSGGRTLVESFDGTRWSLLPSHEVGPPSLDDALAAVSCPSPRSCLAVGNASSSPAGGGRVLVESFDGARWSPVRSPGAGRASGLAGVSCVSPGRCVAAGAYAGAGSIYRTLVEAS
jgi:hypothetical protein